MKYKVEIISRFLPQLMTQFEARGGEIVCQRINDLEELSDFDVVVNCSGLGANQLVGDETVQPLRGQVMRVWAPWLRICLLDDEDDGNYVLPNMDSVVLGGTHQQGDWDTIKCHFCSIFRCYWFQYHAIRQCLWLQTMQMFQYHLKLYIEYRCGGQ